MQKRAETACNSPQNRVSCFRKKCFCVLGTVFGGLLHARMSLFEAFLFSEKRFSRFRDCRMNRRKNADVPFLTILISGKSWLWFGNVFTICPGSAFSHHLQTQNQTHFVRRHLNRQMLPMICDTFYLTRFATEQCCVP